MLIHMFAFRWLPAATADDKARALQELRAFAGRIPGMIEIHVGTNLAARHAGYETGGVMKFTDQAALTAYGDHPLHQALLAWLLPLIEPIEVDFPSE
ncbi:Dabb family protein [Novosphingobium bradum]|uniref:Dabb family protein n=1 Tax=Novosphingobium bradum TaxID=1737444 RepID=A0ABV7IMT9_9SPHN